ncbi:MAG: CPBP family intramembrane metalloprotease [Myxococcales bacterium]|nr:CPBP family intramembrane metalloprotease [Myxococcales bacterium]
MTPLVASAATPGLSLWGGLSGTIVAILLPILAYFAVAPVLWRFFRTTWREIDAEALAERERLAASAGFDRRPAALFAIAALCLTLQEYYGSLRFYMYDVEPWLRELERASGGKGLVSVSRYGELYSFGWWSLTRVLGYFVVPVTAYKLLFPKDSVLDLGLRLRGFTRHAWIYGACLAVVVPFVIAVSYLPEFKNYYPFYKQCSRSWFDFLSWEALYFAQFFALEFFFRGLLLAPLRKSLGSGAIFAMCVPYVMIHFGKPFFEACGAMVAGVALGSLAMKTRSIYFGFLVHVSVALLMDTLAIAHNQGLPTRLWP